MPLLRSFGFRGLRRCIDMARNRLMQRPALHRLWGKTVEAMRYRIGDQQSSYDDSPHSSVCGLERAVCGESCAERLPDWLIRQWRAIHDIDPSIFPDRERIDSIPFCAVHPSAAAPMFSRLMNATGGRPDHVFLVPWLDKGGAERVALNYVHAVRCISPERRIVVVATHPAESPWASKLPEGVPFLEFGNWTAHLNDVEREHLLMRWLMQTVPRIVHNINSRLGFQVFERYGQVLRSRMNLYTSVFCTDFTPDGKRIGYAVEFLPRIIDHLTAVTVDNRTFRNQLMAWYAFDPEKMIVHYQPVSLSGMNGPAELDAGLSGKEKKLSACLPAIGRIEELPRDTLRAMISQKPRLDVLWAGRIDDQKRPDLLLKMIEASADLPFFFHVYGAAVLNQDRYTHRLRQFNNAWYYGSFDGFESLPTGCFDVFLYTSQWDGLPNTLLDALAAGLPVVASDVGGIGEVILHEETGLLVSPFDDVNKYLEQLRRILVYPEKAAQMAKRAKMQIGHNHSWARFVEAVRVVPGYCEP